MYIQIIQFDSWVPDLRNSLPETIWDIILSQILLVAFNCLYMP